MGTLDRIASALGQPARARGRRADPGRRAMVNANSRAELDGDVRAGRVEVVSRRQLGEIRRWRHSFATQHKDRRYYEIVEDSIHPEFGYHYFAIYDRRGEVWAVQPFFVLDLDILAGLRPFARAPIDAVRRIWPRFMVLRALMVGCAAGEGHLDAETIAGRAAIARQLSQSIVKHAAALRAKLIVLKEFPRRDRPALSCFIDQGFTWTPSMPQTRLNVEYASFDEYLETAINSGARRKLRKKFMVAESGAPIELSVVGDVTPWIDEIYDLYLQVYDRSTLRFEKLTRRYFCGLGARMPDKARFFIWRRDGVAVAFCNCMVCGDVLFAEYLGLDYRVALDVHLYHYIFRDLIRWAIADGYRRIQNGSLNYDPKLHFRHRLDPLDLYVKHVSPLWNAALRYALPWLEPSRYDATLEKFPNYHELWN